uniref:WD repeat-containing protein 91 n=1 Tax=Ciona savignyi TaxID=51511 RepID=H2YX75_CIOSA
MVHTPVEPPPSDNNVMQRSKKSGYHNQKRELLRISRSIETDHLSKPNLKSDIQPSNVSVIPSLPKDIKESKSIPLLGKPELNSTPISSSKQWLPNENAEDPFLILSKDEYHEHHSSIMQCRFNSQGTSIASCDKDGTVKVWKFEPSPVTIATVISRSPFLSVDWHKTASDLLILGTSQGVIKLFDTSSKLDQFDTIIPGNCPRITQLACHPNGATFATSCVSNLGYEGLRLNNSSPSNPGRVQIWNINESQITLESSILECNDRHIECLAYSENGICLATGDTNGLLTVLDTRTYKVILSREAHKGPIYTVQFSKDEKFVLTLGADGKFCAWNLASPIEPINLPIHALAGGPFEVTGFGGYKQVQQPGGGKLFTFEPNGSHVLTCDGTSAVIYDVNLSNASMSKVLTLVGHRSPVLSLEWTSSSKCGYCLTGSMDGRLLVTTLLNKLS